MSEPKVSVIIPVYNTEKYLRECLDSVVNQTLKDIEIICVDDGSTDQSVAILEEYQKQDCRIQILRQQNQYAGVARNNGMKAATGKYIIFLDSDDFFALDMLEKAFYCAEKNQVEIVLFDYYTYDELTGHSRPHRTKGMPPSVLSPEEMGSRLYTACKSVPWNKLVLRQFLLDNHISFQEIRKSNDLYYSLLCVSLAKRIKFIPKCFVNYRTGNPNSLQGNTNKGMECGIISRVFLKRELKERAIFQGYVKELFFQCCQSIKDYFDKITNSDAMEQFYQELKKDLIPGLFDSPSDFEDDAFLNNIYESNGVSDFLRRLLQTERKLLQTERNEKAQNYILKSSWEARLGGMILFIPKRIRNLLKHRRS